jgi:hypothetical protein
VVDDQNDDRTDQFLLADTREVLARARQGDVSALPLLKELLNSHPEVWQTYADLGVHARSAWIELISGPDLTMQEALARKAEAMRAELAGPSPMPLEALLAERVVTCWMQATYADIAVAKAGDATIKQADFAEKRAGAAHTRYLTAISALTTLRRHLPSGSVLSSAKPVELNCGPEPMVCEETAFATQARSKSTPEARAKESKHDDPTKSEVLAFAPRKNVAERRRRRTAGENRGV